jgi:hypothetical protein
MASSESVKNLSQQQTMKEPELAYLDKVLKKTLLRACGN